MAILSNINGKFAVDSSGGIQFSGQTGTSGYVLKSNGNAAPTWVAASTVIGGPYLPLSGGTLTGSTATASGISFTVGGALSVSGTISQATASSVLGSFKGTSAAGYAEFNILNDVNHSIVIGSIGSTYSNVDWAGSTYIYNIGSKKMYIKSQNEMRFITNGTSVANNTALVLDTSYNATFAGNITAVRGFFNSGSTNVVATFTSTDAVAGIALIDSGGNVELSASGNTFQVQPAGGAAVLSVSSTGSTFVGAAASGAPLVTIENNSGSTATSYGLLVKGGGNSSSGKTFEVRDDSGNTDLMVKGNGNVGIGTVSPEAKLDISVLGAAYALEISTPERNRALFYYNSNSTSDSGYLGIKQGSVDTLNHRFASTGNSAVCIEEGNFGIRTDSPGAQLHNYSTSATDVWISGYGTLAQNDWRAGHAMFVNTDNGLLISKANANNNTNRLFSFYNDANGYAQLYMYKGDSTAQVQIKTSGYSYFNGGNVGIGTTSPDATLDVHAPSTTAPSLAMGAAAGQIFKNEDSELAFGLQNQAPYNVWMQSRFNGNVSRPLIINPLGGNVGIGTTSPSTKLSINDANYVEMATFSAASGSTSGIVSNNSGYITSFITSATHQSSNTALFVPVTDGIKITKPGLLQVAVTQDFQSTGSSNYAQVQIRKNASIMFYSLRTNTNSQWDMFNSTGTMIVAANDIIKFYYTATDFLAMDGTAWSQYSFIWTSR